MMRAPINQCVTLPVFLIRLAWLFDVGEAIVALCRIATFTGVYQFTISPYAARAGCQCL